MKFVTNNARKLGPYPMNAYLDSYLIYLDKNIQIPSNWKTKYLKNQSKSFMKQLNRTYYQEYSDHIFKLAKIDENGSLDILKALRNKVGFIAWAALYAKRKKYLK